MKRKTQIFRKINQNLIDNQVNTTKTINGVIDSKLDTFIKSIDVAHKFYSDIINSYCNYLRNIKLSMKFHSIL
jgi:hypothetical protein